MVYVSKWWQLGWYSLRKQIGKFLDWVELFFNFIRGYYDSVFVFVTVVAYFFTSNLNGS